MKAPFSLSSYLNRNYLVLAFVSKRYPSLRGRLPTCYSPVCHWMKIHFQLCASTPFSMGHSVRLACLRHAASVHPEPGSNSPKKFIFWIISLFYSWLFELTFCSVFKDHSLPFFLKALLIYQMLLYLSTLFLHFFIFFQLFLNWM